MKPNRTIPWVAAMAAIFWTATAVAGSPDPKQPRSKANAPAESIKMPTAVSSPRPRVKLDDQAIEAISKPRVPAVQAIQDQKPAIKPAQVPVKVVQPPQKPAKPEMVQRPVKPMAPSTSPGARVERPVIPDVLDDRQARQIQQAREVAEVARIARELNTDIHQAARMPERAVADSAAGTAFEGYGPAVMGNGPDANQIIHELYFGRLGGIDSVGIGLADDGLISSDPTRSGASASGAPGPDNRASGDPDGTGALVSFWNGSGEDGFQSLLKAVGVGAEVVGASAAGFGVAVVAAWDSMRSSNAGEINVSPQISRDVDGDGRPDMSRGDTRDHLERDTDGDGVADQSVDPRAESDNEAEEAERQAHVSQPAEGSGWTNPDACNFNPITKRCHGPGKSRAYDGEMTGQPSPSGEGDEEPGTASPSVGIAAVINPDPEATRNHGLDTSKRPLSGIQGVVDPEEGVPGGPVPGSMSDADLDAALGLAALD